MPRKASRKNANRTIALCYVRKSWTNKDRDKDDNANGDNDLDQISPERQRAHIQAVCDAHGWTPEWYEDTEGHKSGMHEKNRPGWLALKARLGNPDVIALVANDLARLHRKGWRIGDLLDFVEQHEIKLVLADPRRQIDFSTPYGRMFAQLSSGTLSTSPSAGRPTSPTANRRASPSVCRPLAPNAARKPACSNRATKARGSCRTAPGKRARSARNLRSTAPCGAATSTAPGAS
jgi:hypothetical protein